MSCHVIGALYNFKTKINYTIGDSNARKLVFHFSAVHYVINFIIIIIYYLYLFYFILNALFCLFNFIRLDFPSKCDLRMPIIFIEENKNKLFIIV